MIYLVKFTKDESAITIAIESHEELTKYVLAALMNTNRGDIQLLIRLS